MVPLVVTALVVVLLPLAVIVFKSPGALLFLMLLAGTTLERQFGGVTRSFTGAFVSSSSKWPVNELTSVGLFLLPVLLCLLLVRKVTPAKTLLFQVIAATAGGVVLLYQVHALGSSSMRSFIEDSALWPFVRSYYGGVLAIGLAISFAAFLMSRSKEDSHKRHRFHKKH